MFGSVAYADSNPNFIFKGWYGVSGQYKARFVDDKGEYLYYWLMNEVRGHIAIEVWAKGRGDEPKGDMLISIAWQGSTPSIASDFSDYPSANQAIQLRRTLEQEPTIINFLRQKFQEQLRIAIDDNNIEAQKRIRAELDRLETKE